MGALNAPLSVTSLVARQVLPGYIHDMTLSGAFNAPYQPAELGMTTLFAIISLDNDHFAIVVTP